MHGQRGSLLEGNFGWVVLSNAEAAASLAGGSAIEGFLTIDTANAEPIFGERPEKVKLHVHVVGPATEAVQLGASLLIRYSLENSIWITEEVFALFDFDDQAILLSVCSQEYTARIREVAMASGASSVTNFVRDAADPAAPENALMAEEFAIPTVTTVPDTSWYDLDPDQRSLDPSDAPPEVIAQLDWAQL